MSDNTYNGWTNRETWALMLWINNDEGLQNWAHEITRSNADQDPYTREKTIREWVETLLSHNSYTEEYGAPWPEGLATMAEDVGSLWRINWNEVAEKLLEDLQELADA